MTTTDRKAGPMPTTTEKTAQPPAPEALTEQAAAWDAEQAAALAELEQAEAAAGPAMLDDPAAVEALAARVASLRTRADLAGRAAAEARRRAQAARVADLRAQADKLEPEAVKARKALDRHQAEADQLRRALEDFTGAPWQVVPERAMHETGPRTRPARPGEKLAGALRDVLDRQARLRADADAIAEDPAWVPPAEQQARRLRGEWEQSVAGYRQAAADLADARGQLDDLAAALRGQVADVTEVPGHLALSARVATLEQGMSTFRADVDFFRGLGLDLPDAEVSALADELGPAAAAAG